MKKAFQIFLIVLFLLQSVVFTVSAETASRRIVNPLDSVNFSEEEKSLYRDSPEDTVIKIYNYGFAPSAFSARMPCESIIRVPYNIMFATGFPVYLVVSPTGEATIKYVDQDDVANPYEEICYPFETNWDNIYPYILDASLLFGETKIHSIYCFNTYLAYFNGPLRTPDSGISAFFITQKGDFILHKPDSSGEKVYVLPEDDFVEYMTIVDEYMDTDDYNGQSIANCGFDLEPYRLENFLLEPQEPSDPGEPNVPQVPSEPTEPQKPGEQNAATGNNASPAWYIWASVGLGGAVIGSGITLGAFHFRKKKKQS